MDPKLDNFWTSLGTILEPILEPKMHQQIDQKWTSFWTKKGGPGSRQSPLPAAPQELLLPLAQS